MAEHAQDDDQDVTLLERWRQTEPLRLWLYGVAAPLLLALVGYAVMTNQQGALWLAVLQAALLGAGTEGARQFAVSPATARAAVEQTARAVNKYGTTDPATTARQVLIRYRIPN